MDDIWSNDHYSACFFDEQELYEQMISLTIKVVDEDKPGSKYGEELSSGVWSGMLGEVNTP